MSAPYPDPAPVSSDKVGVGGKGGKCGNKKKNWFKKPMRQERFVGRTTDLNGHIYDCSDIRQADQFIKTTKEIAEYIGRTYKFAGDIRSAILAQELPILLEPEEPQDENNRIAFKRWELAEQLYSRQKTALTENNKTLFSLVWGQCSDAMQQKLESHDEFAALSIDSDGIGLLQLIKNTAYNFQAQKYRVESINEALKQIITHRQESHVSAHDYYESFLNKIEVYVFSGGSTEPSPGALEYAIELLGWNANEITESKKAIARDMEWANMFLLNADQGQYGELLITLQNDYLNGQNNYPRTLVEAYNRILYWKSPKLRFTIRTANNGVTFVHTGNNDEVTLTTAGRSQPRVKKSKEQIRCFKCGKLGHYAPQCPGHNTASEADGMSGEQLLIDGVNNGEFDDEPSMCSFQFAVIGSIVLQQSSHGSTIPKSWILLDNQSTIDVFSNRSLLKKICW